MSYGAIPLTENLRPKYPRSPHTVDGDTVAHWEFDDDGACDVVSPGQDFSVNASIVYPIIYPGQTTRCLPDGNLNVARSGVNAGHVAALDCGATTAFTVAGCAFLTGYSAPLLKLSNDSGGFTEKFVIECQAGPSLRYGHATGGSTYESASHAGGSSTGNRPGFPLGEWFWFACVKNADGQSGILRVNDDQSTWTTTAVSVTNSSARWSVMNAFDNTRCVGAVYSLILKDIACTTDQLNEMKRQTGL